MDQFPDNQIICLSDFECSNAGDTIIDVTTSFECSLNYPSNTCGADTPLPSLPAGYVDKKLLFILQLIHLLPTFQLLNVMLLRMMM